MFIQFRSTNKLYVASFLVLSGPDDQKLYVRSGSNTSWVNDLF